jgi:hypothetical protein
LAIDNESREGTICTGCMTTVKARKNEVINEEIPELGFRAAPRVLEYRQRVKLPQ